MVQCLIRIISIDLFIVLKLSLIEIKKVNGALQREIKL